MRSMKLVALGALALSAFAGCGQGQPRIYRGAVDATPMRTIAVPSCFRGNKLPDGRGNINEQNYRSEDEWVIWNGVVNEKNQQVEYLDLGTQSFELGNAPIIKVSDLIQGVEKTFAALRTEQRPVSNYTEARQTQVSVKFDDYSASPVGKLDLNSIYACSGPGCPTDAISSPPDAASCAVSLDFVARRIEAQQMTVYNNNPQ